MGNNCENCIAGNRCPLSVLVNRSGCGTYWYPVDYQKPLPEGYWAALLRAAGVQSNVSSR